MPEIAESLASIPIPQEFFRDLLPRVRDLSELKVTLFVFQLGAAAGKPGVPLSVLSDPRVVKAVVGTESPEPLEERFRRIVNRAVANGLLFRLTVTLGDEVEPFYLPAIPRNRELIERLRADQQGVAPDIGLPEDAEVSLYRPNIFAYYEQHVGPLTPLVAEQLREAEAAYPRGWIEEAIQQALRYNRRSWRYIETILVRWEETGGLDRGSFRHS